MLKPSSEQLARDVAQFQSRGGRVEQLPPGAHTEPVLKADHTAPTAYHSARARGRATQRASRAPLPSTSASLPSPSASVAFFDPEDES